MMSANCSSVFVCCGPIFDVQLMVIYYGNIPEETHYVIVRTMPAPWNKLAWVVFIVCFIGPFFIL